jgi:TRAP-type mannitol/chloroaromatic compound transport system permease large subunit
MHYVRMFDVLYVGTMYVGTMYVGMMYVFTYVPYVVCMYIRTPNITVKNASKGRTVLKTTVEIGVHYCSACPKRKQSYTVLSLRNTK